MKRILILLLILALVIFFSVCKPTNESGDTSETGNTDTSDSGETGDTGDTSPQTYVVIYDGNGYTGGDIPVDNTEYTVDDSVTVLGNTGNLVKTFYTFAGWNTLSDGNGDSYYVNDTFSMPVYDVTLYAQWIEVISYRDIVNVPGTTDGSYTQEDTSGNSFVHNISSFDIGMYEVTYELWYYVYQWATVTDGTYTFSNPGREGYGGTAGDPPTPDNKYEPVIYINWRDAIVWCNAYSEISDLSPVYFSDVAFTTLIKDSTNDTLCDNAIPKPTANGFRLPTEGEWQYAARYIDGSTWLSPDHVSGDVTSYCYPEDGSESTVYNDYAWSYDNSYTNTHDVGSKLANHLGVYDMTGNVYEICWDKHGSYPTGPETDYMGPASGSDRMKLGGSWYNGNIDLQVGYRLSYSVPSLPSITKGLRIVRHQ